MSVMFTNVPSFLRGKVEILKALGAPVGSALFWISMADFMVQQLVQQHGREGLDEVFAMINHLDELNGARGGEGDPETDAQFAEIMKHFDESASSDDELPN